MWYCLDCATCLCLVRMLMCSQQDSDVSQAVAASLATFFKQIGLSDTAGILDTCISFHTRDKRASWLKSSRKVCKISLSCCAICPTCKLTLIFLLEVNNQACWQFRSYMSDLYIW